MKSIGILIVLMSCVATLKAQHVSEKKVARVLQTLSADDMEGRKIFTPGIEKAANFIAEEFKTAGLKFYTGLSDYKQSFGLVKTKLLSASAVVNDSILNQKNIIVLSNEKSLDIHGTGGWMLTSMQADKDFNDQSEELANSKNKMIVQVPLVFEKKFSNLKRYKNKDAGNNQNLVFVLWDGSITNFTLHFSQDVEIQNLTNVIGVLPGKALPNEYVVFSAHYDHLGIGKANEAGDSIYNGANDDASGVTAVIALANYYKKLNNNARTLIFIAFTAEESGGFGSTYFSKHINPDAVMAMGNIEMIGTTSKWGDKAVYVTGSEKSNMISLLQSSVPAKKLSYHEDPYPTQNLFYRSDNATLAVLGVPAHTISTSQMDGDKTYHTVDDEFATMNVKVITNVIKGIAQSFRDIVQGKATPTRVEKLEKK